MRLWEGTEERDLEDASEPVVLLAVVSLLVILILSILILISRSLGGV